MDRQRAHGEVGHAEPQSERTPSPAQELGVTIFLMLIGLGLVIGGFGYGIGSLSAPQTGFVPMVVGASMILFGGVLLVQDLTHRGRHSELNTLEGDRHPMAEGGLAASSGAQPEPRTSRMNSPLSMVVCVLCFGFVLATTELLGLLVTTAIIVGVLAFIMKTRWWASILVAGGFYLFGYLVFAMWLEIPLPFGTINGG